MSNIISLDEIVRREPLAPPPSKDGHEKGLHNQGVRRRSIDRSTVDAAAIEKELKQAIEGEVRFSDGDRALYATDGSNYRQVPIGVVIPKTIDDVVKTVAICRKYSAPILSRGGGTSLTGGCCNVAVVMDFAKYLNRVLDVDPDKKLGRVEPGCVLDDLRNAAEKYHLTFGPDPSTHNHNSIGGMIGNDSCGVHSVLAAKEGTGARTCDNVESLEILLYDGTRMTVGGKISEEELDQIIRQGGRKGEIYGKLRDLRDKYADLIRQKYPNIPRRVSGYALEQLLPENGFNVARCLAGSEGTCVTMLECTMNLVYSPPARSLLVLGYPDVFSAGDHIPEVMAANPTGCEGIDDLLIKYMKLQGIHPEDVVLLPPGGGWLMVEFGGETKEDSDAQAKKLMDELKSKPNPPSMKLFDNPDEEEMLWKVREAGLGATAHVPNEPSTWPGWEDSAVPPDKVGPYLRDLRGLFDKYGYSSTSLYGHFGQGCIHCSIPFDLKTKQGIANFRSFLYEATDLVVKYGGSCSGEHGDGQARAELLPRMFGDELIQAFREFKSIWDPEWRMNPGKKVDAYAVDENLRLGEHYNPTDPKTHFKFMQDSGSFAEATLRCAGVGLCRRHEGGTMCPSYMVTHEEKHSTRGRSRLLFEMLQGNPMSGGWKSEPVKEALDLCLACKGCKGDCPLHVDMATYKAEFLSHYYEGRVRPRHAYAFGWIHIWAKLANAIPGVTSLINLVTQNPILAPIAKRLAGMAPERKIPAFATETFKDWFFKRDVRNEGKPQVVLWADTFNNYFHVETAKAAVEVLEAAGFQVVVPKADMCCGRPLYDYGFLDMAESWLENIMKNMREEIQDGTPVVVLEPSCAAVFKDELVNLLPQDQDANRLNRQVFLLSEFLQQKAPGFEIPKLQRKAVVHGHCHHKALFKMNAETEVLKRMGVDFDMPEDGCCGMAGAFGFEEGDHYDVSMKCGERVLIPKVKEEPKDTLLVANGFSCREQISQTTDRHALHLAQVIKMAMDEGEHGAAGDFPEKKYLTQPTPDTKAVAGLAVGAGALIAGVIALAVMKNRKDY
jgi:FAD/FMN-containing dehydrogenase/Fe-S oxidoreductase